MTTHYDKPGALARTANKFIGALAEAGISIAGTRALRVRGRKTGELRAVVVNVLSVGGSQYLVSPRGNTQWVRNARAAGVIELGPRWHREDITITEVADDAKPVLVQEYLRRWHWEVKGHFAGLTPSSTSAELKQAAPAIPVFELRR